jgi:serine/threonine protein kinase
MSPEHKYSLPPGLSLRQYRIVRLLGHGGFGLTYLADDAKLNRKVAIKELFPIDFAIRGADGTTVMARSQRDKTNLEWARQRFMEEGRTLAALHHPSILRVYDIFELHGTAYLVTDFIEGSTFEERLRRGSALRQEELFFLAHSLLDALQLVHKQGFLHRDIKPENILIAEKTSRPVLIDFGNARVATGQKTSSMTAVLTRGYAPFEQYQSKTRQRPSTDLYALGAVLYRAIKGAPPDDALDRLDEDKIQVLSQRRIPGYTREFLATIDKALNMRPEDRWQSCEAWKTALRAGGGQGISPPAPAPPPHRARFRAGLAIAVIAVLALCGAGIGLFKWNSDGPSASAGNQDSSELAAHSQATPASHGLGGFMPSSPLLPPSNATTGGVTPDRATADHPFVNSLGMKFVPVEITGGPTNGKQVLFGVWDTRVQDYATFAREKGIAPEKPNFEQGPTHPVVNVNWQDAKSFCDWLTDKEQASGKIGRQQQYRLPSDHEWSCAVGIGRMEKAESSPEAKRSQLGPLYPWGKQWPPPKGFGNYDPTFKVDDFENTSPVGSFAANPSGLYDMGGNVWQWCEDFFDSKTGDRVLRGGAYFYDVELCLRSSFRMTNPPMDRNSLFGFRCVLAASGG